MREKFGPPCKQPIVTIQICGRDVTVNKKAARHFKRLGLILQRYAPMYAHKIDDFLDDWGYACRTIAGSSTYSNHAFGTAVDVDATKNARNGRPYTDSAIWKEAKKAVLQAEKEGFRWGGRYSSPDPMHFETLLTPVQIKARYDRRGEPRAWFKRKLQAG